MIGRAQVSCLPVLWGRREGLAAPFLSIGCNRGSPQMQGGAHRTAKRTPDTHHSHCVSPGALGVKGTDMGCASVPLAPVIPLQVIPSTLFRAHPCTPPPGSPRQAHQGEPTLPPPPAAAFLPRLCGGLEKVEAW